MGKKKVEEILNLSEELRPADGSGLEVGPSEVHQSRAQVLGAGCQVRAWNILGFMFTGHSGFGPN